MLLGVILDMNISGLVDIREHDSKTLEFVFVEDRMERSALANLIVAMVAGEDMVLSDIERNDHELGESGNVWYLCVLFSSRR